jgi:GSH-dependent disulfide-bond oxidoreductase
MINLHSVATANGYKVSIMLEETALPYTVKAYDLIKGENFAPEFLALNPVGRLPVVIDHDVPTGAPPIVVYGSMPILVYLAEKTGKFLPREPRARAATFEWLGTISGDAQPAYSGQFTFNYILKDKLPAAIDYYNKLCTRMLQPLELRLGQARYLAGDEYTIADMIAYPLAAISARRYPGDLSAHPNLSRWAAELAARPAVARGMKIPS